MQIEFLGDGDRYELQSPIARGYLSTVYRGRDKVLNRMVAIKVLRDIYSTDLIFVRRFQRGAGVMLSLRHPNIAQVYDYGQANDNYFIVMELIEGTDLRRYHRSRGVLDIERAINIAHGVALGLGAAHRRGIVHRDVQPTNVLVARDGSIKLIGFSFASIDDEHHDRAGMPFGMAFLVPSRLSEPKGDSELSRLVEAL